MSVYQHTVLEQSASKYICASGNVCWANRFGPGAGNDIMLPSSACPGCIYRVATRASGVTDCCVKIFHVTAVGHPMSRADLFSRAWCLCGCTGGEHCWVCFWWCMQWIHQFKNNPGCRPVSKPTTMRLPHILECEWCRHLPCYSSCLCSNHWVSWPLCHQLEGCVTRCIGGCSLGWGGNPKLPPTGLQSLCCWDRYGEKWLLGANATNLVGDTLGDQVKICWLVNTPNIVHSRAFFRSNLAIQWKVKLMILIILEGNLLKPSHLNCGWPTDWPTDQPTDQPTTEE